MLKITAPARSSCEKQCEALHVFCQWSLLAIMFLFRNAFCAEGLKLIIEEFQNNTKSGGLLKMVTTEMVYHFKQFVQTLFLFLSFSDCLYMYKYIKKYTYVYINMYTCIHIYKYTHVYISIFLYINIQTIHTYGYTNYTYVWIYLSTCMQERAFLFKIWPCKLSTHCNTLQHTATHCNTLQHTATHYNTL